MYSWSHLQRALQGGEGEGGQTLRAEVGEGGGGGGEEREGALLEGEGELEKDAVTVEGAGSVCLITQLL